MSKLRNNINLEYSVKYSKYLEYIKNSGPMVKIVNFDEDWEPIGPKIRSEMKK